MAKKNKHAKMELEVNEQAVEQAPEEVVVEEVAPKKAEAPKVAFDGWYAVRSAAIPAIHKKEIIKADFKARKVPMVATMAEFDKALEKYGIKLA